MEKENTVVEKSKQFAIDIIGLYKTLSTERKENILSRQLLRSGTSIGANIAEAVCAISRRDFLSKMYISYKEAAETKYWIDLLGQTGYITLSERETIEKKCNELFKMLASITKTTAASLRNESKKDLPYPSSLQADEPPFTPFE